MPSRKEMKKMKEMWGELNKEFETGIKPDPLQGTSAKREEKNKYQDSMPKYPCISVYANEGPFEGGHASIYIAANDNRISVPANTMRYIYTDLQGNEDEPAKIYIQVAKKWANPRKSKTWKISQVRAENAIAVALEFARTQRFWTGPSGGMIKAREYFEQKNAPENLRRDVPFLYGKKGTFKESYSLGRKLKRQRREYMTCASYAEAIMKAAGVEAPFSMGIQSGSNMVKYDKNLFHVFARLKNLGGEVSGSIGSFVKKSLKLS